jgi:excinuclease ABC subunit A
MRARADQHAGRASRARGGSASQTGDNGAVPWLIVRGATHHNLKNIDVAFPLGRFTCVTGVSGSGKSSLVNDILYAALARELNRATNVVPGSHRRIDGLEHLDKVVAIDQAPIGRTPRSNPATYVKVFDEIRALFARLPDARLRGYRPGRFSFNVPAARGGGRCEACAGNGANRIEMDFLADVWATCPVCNGRRFNRETLQIRYRGKSIADVLEMDVREALEHFENIPPIRAKLQTLHDVGLDYIKLGQPSTTLSGGEAQRIKLARELSRKATGRTLYILDEPTTGLHFDEIRLLLAILHGLVDAGNTVIVIEHNLDVVKTADWIIDLGPEGGDAGGYIVVEGTPEQVAACPHSYTAAALRQVLERSSWVPPTPASVPTPASAPPAQSVTVVGASEHNLKNLTVGFPRNAITVCTGVSGSGKTSFAVDTVFTEGYRRYVESLSAYARQFLGQMPRPRVERVEGLSPAICIEQKTAGKSPRSTVGTITEIYDYMRVLWARVGTPYCPRCQVPVGSQTADEIVDRILALPAGAPIMILAPISPADGETYAALFARLTASGYLRVRIDGQVQLAAQAATLDPRRKHRLEVVVDRTTVRNSARGRIAESVEHALNLGNGVMILLKEAVEIVEENAPDAQVRQLAAQELLFSQKRACSQCGASYQELGPQEFSFNSPLGWCETCEGLGVQRGAAPTEIIRRPTRSLFDGAIAGWERLSQRSPLGRMLVALCRHLGVDPETPLSNWTPTQRQILLFGAPPGQWIDASDAFENVRFQWRGLFPALDAAMRNSWTLRQRLHGVLTEIPCVACRGGRLRPEAAAVRLGGAAGRTIVEVCQMPIRQAAQFFSALELDDYQLQIAGELLREIRTRLQFLVDIGLDYLTLHRAAPTLSGGEAQRIRLAGQIGSGLSGVLYVLDEPTIGLHPRDTRRLIDALKKLRDLGNTLLVVEHDRDVIRNADRLLDFGPRAGADGGRIVAEGTPAEFFTPAPEDTSLTRAYLGGQRAIPIPTNRRPVTWQPDSAPGPEQDTTAQPAAFLVVRGARQNNLKNIDVPIPLGRFVCVTGVSGSGKSSLVSDILYPALANVLSAAGLTVGDHDGLEIVRPDQTRQPLRRSRTALIDKVVNVDQSPIGTTPASNPATYTGVFDDIRELFARLPESRIRGYNANRFSFNRPGGRCEACEGYGQKCIEMHFMADVWVECEACHGKRYNAQTLEVRFKGRSIADVLSMRVREALELFENVPRIRRMLKMLVDVGLDYLPLGQPAPTLSGGEAQRVRLAAELGKPNTGRAFYILDEPTTGLHFDDIHKLLAVIQRLVDLGNTVLVVEHNLDVIKCADWVIDLGPEAGDAGGYLVAAGTPEKLVERLQTARPGTDFTSHTAVALAPILQAGPHQVRAAFDPAAHAAEELAAARGGLGRLTQHHLLPWRIDGRKWHLSQRLSRQGRPVRWEPAALEYVIELVHKSGRFEATDWSDRARVEITAAGAPTWFLHALTGGEWLLELHFRVPRGAFSPQDFDDALGLKALNERRDLPVSGDFSRVELRRRADGWDAVVVYVHDRREIDTPAFRRFVRKAARAYLQEVSGS